MRILFIDFETQGLPLRGEPSENPSHPWPCSVSAILDEDGKSRGAMYSLIKVPPETQWEPKAQEVNGLDHQLCERFGHSLGQVLQQIDDLAAHADTICAFSWFFDMKFLKIGCARIPIGDSMRQRFESKDKACTMEASARHFVGPTARFIKLSLAYHNAFGTTFEGAHSALEDNLAQRRLYYWLRREGVKDFGGTTSVKNTGGEFDAGTALTNAMGAATGGAAPYQKVSPAPAGAPKTIDPLDDMVAPARRKPAAL